MSESHDDETLHSGSEKVTEAETEVDDAPEAVAGPTRRQRTRVDEMGIPPLWAVGGDKGKTKEFKKQLAAAEQALESARTDARDANERYLRTAAEMENMRRRHQKDRSDQLLYGNADLIVRILPLLDNFHRALDHVPASAENDAEVRQWVSGLLMVVRQFEDILEGAGVEAIDTSEGQAFDPALHQAVMGEASEAHEDGQVIAELQRGYRLRDRVLRPAMVKVANNQ
ncbi:MAG: nucleotide exchange factor GrpE [Candidatus Dormibacteria bacterium]